MPFQLSDSYLDSFGSAGMARGRRRRRGHTHGMKAGQAKAMTATMGRALGIVTTGGTAFGLGFLEKKYGMPVIPGLNVPVDIAAAGVIHAIGFWGKLPSGMTERVLTGMANGALAYWAGVQGNLMAGGVHTEGSLAKIGDENYPVLAQNARPAMTPEQLWQMQYR